MTRWTLCLLGLAVVAGLLAREAAFHDKVILTHDESISYLAATCHQGDFDRMQAGTSGLEARWVPAADWQRFLALDRRGCFATIARDLADTDIHPPAFFWLLHVWTLLWGVGIATGSWLNVAIDIVTALAVFGLARHVLRGPVAAAGATLVWALSPAVVPIAAEVRQYDLLALSTVLLVWALVRVLDRPTARACLALVAATALGMLTHYQFATIVAGAGVLGLVALARPPRRAGLLALAACAGGLLVAASLHPGFLESFARAGAQADGLASVGAQWRAGRVLRTMASFVLPGALLVGPLALIVSLALAGTMLAQARATVRDRDIAAVRITFLALWTIAAFCGTYLTGFSHGFAMGGKYLSAAWPLVAILVTRAVASLNPRIRTPAAATGVAIVVALGIFAGVSWQRPSTDGTTPLVRGADRALVDVTRRGELLRTVMLLPPRSPVFAADQATLRDDEARWTRRISAGGVYISVIAGANSDRGQRAVVNEIRRHTCVTRQRVALADVGDVYVIARRPSLDAYRTGWTCRATAPLPRGEAEARSCPNSTNRISCVSSRMRGRSQPAPVAR